MCLRSGGNIPLEYFTLAISFIYYVGKKYWDGRLSSDPKEWPVWGGAKTDNSSSDGSSAPSGSL